MKKALKVVGAYAVLFVVCIIIAGFGDAAAGAAAAIFMVAILVGIIALPVCLIRKSRRKENKPETAPQEERQPVVQVSKAPVTITKSTAVPTVKNAISLDDLPLDDDDDDNDDIAYRYTYVGVFVPYIDVFDHPALVKGAIVSFRQEPENKFDHSAVAVVIGRKRIGYLYRGKLQDMANDWLERGDAVSGRVVRVSPYATDVKRDGVKINLYFYK